MFFYIRDFFGCGVRPAAHLSLSSLASSAGYEISASLASGATDRALIALSDDFVSKSSETEISAYFTPNTSNDFISAISINNVNIDISASVASAGTFLELSGVCKYKCYYSYSIVYVIIKNLSVNVSITATVIDTPIVVTLSGNSTKATKSISFDAGTKNAVVTIIPQSGYYVASAYLDSNSAQLIDSWNDMIYQPSSAYRVRYEATDYSLKVKFYFDEIDGSVTLNVNIASGTPPTLKQGGGTEITGVALQTRLSGTTDTLACVGKATITGYSTTDGLDEVIVYATASAGYQFSHWEVEGVALDTATYGISARIPYETVNGKILVAVFITNDAKTNTDTETTDNGGFV